MSEVAVGAVWEGKRKASATSKRCVRRLRAKEKDQDDYGDGGFGAERRRHCPRVEAEGKWEYTEELKKDKKARTARCGAALCRACGA
jgi:hypothetical protein